MKRYVLAMLAALTLVACGGGGGGATTTVNGQTCESTVSSNGTTVCLNKVLVNGAAYTTEFNYAAGGDVSGDTYPDIIMSFVNSTSNTTTSVLTMFKGSSDGRSFTSWAPISVDAYYPRDIVFANFNGNMGFYVADESESFPLTGKKQYAYTSDGAGNFTKVEIDTGTSGSSIHGASIGSSSTDGFTLAINNPWVTSNSITTYNGISGAGPFAATWTETGATNSCFYMAAVQLRPTASSGKDLICFSPVASNNGQVTSDPSTHTIFNNQNNRASNGGNSTFAAGATFSNPKQYWAVEEVVVGNFSGHTDGVQDFAVLQVDRRLPDSSFISTVRHTALTVYITNSSGVPVESTSTYLACATCSDFTDDTSGFHRLVAADLNGDGKDDIAMIRDVGTGGSVSRQLEILVNNTGNFKRSTVTGWIGPGIAAIKLPNNKYELLFYYNGKVTVATAQ